MTVLPWDTVGQIGLPSRELIADAAETVINAHWFDGVFYIPNCDRITPGMILAAMRTNVPAVFLFWRTYEGIGVDMTGHHASLSSLFEAVGSYQAGEMSEQEFEFLEKNGMAYGSCSGMFTANSMVSGGIGTCIAREWYNSCSVRMNDENLFAKLPNT